MFKKTAQTLLISVIAMNACYAMEDDNPEKKKGFINKCIGLKKKLLNKDDKKNKNLKIEIIDQKIGILNQEIESMESMDQTESFDEIIEIVDQKTIIEIKDNPSNISWVKVKPFLDHFFIKQATEGLFGPHIFPAEIRQIIAKYSYAIVSQDLVCPFPSEKAGKRMASYIGKTMRSDRDILLFKVGGITMKTVGYDLSRTYDPMPGISLDYDFFFRVGKEFPSEEFLSEENMSAHFFYNENRGDFDPCAFLITGFYDFWGQPIDLSASSIRLMPITREAYNAVDRGDHMYPTPENVALQIVKDKDK